MSKPASLFGKAAHANTVVLAICKMDTTLLRVSRSGEAISELKMHYRYLAHRRRRKEWPARDQPKSDL